MHKNGLVKFIAILFTLISLLQISYTYVVNKIEKDAENYSITKVNVDEEDYGAYLNWLTHADATLTFPQTVFIRYTLQEPGVADAAAEGYKRWFVARLKLLEATLNDREYLCSNRFTIADICVSYAIYLAGTLGIEQAFKPNIKRWTDMLFEREAFKKVIEYKYDGPGPSGPEELK